jgi:hypothetical protein
MESKEALDKIIRKSRVHLYKPIQIAEILYRFRKQGDIEPSDFETYRNASKKWRDEVSKRLVGRVSTSSQKFQDNLFESNAMPPRLMKELARLNNMHEGIVESYIYHRLKERLSMVFVAMTYIKETEPERFALNEFLGIFRQVPGLRRSIDKVYEIIVYALFSTLVRALRVEVSMSIGNLDEEILKDFEEFVSLVLGLSKGKPLKKMPAKLYRVGVTNAADRGLDMWTNYGPAIQVKHITLSEELAEDVSENIAADKIVLVCLDAEATIIETVMKQMPFGERIQGIITLSDLDEWYKTCLSAKYRDKLGRQLLLDLEREFEMEFPLHVEIEPFMKERGYDSAKLTGDWSLL